MALRLSKYDGIPRMAVVRGNTFDADEKFDYAITTHHSLIFAFDSCYEIDDPHEVLSDFLHDGDIITVNEYGLLNKIYDNTTRDATVFITGQCNSNCIMCPDSDYERQHNTGYSDEWLYRYVEMLPADISHVCVTGGEPTLRTRQFFEVMRKLAARFTNVECTLLSNGRSFASKRIVKEMLDYCPRYLTVAIPLHGHTAELHDQITRTDGSFFQTCTGIKHLLSNKVAVEIRIVVSKINYRYLKNIAEFIVLNFPSATIVNFVGLETMGNCAKNLSKVFIDYMESFPYIKEALLVLIEAGIDTSIYNYPLCTVERGYWSLCQRSITPSKVRYDAACNSCEAKEYCSGFFGSTLSVTKPQVRPIIIDNDIGVSDKC